MQNDVSFPFSSHSYSRHAASSWIDEVIPPWQKKALIMDQMEQITIQNLYATITVPDRCLYEASVYLALSLLTQKKVFYRSWDRVFPFPSLYRSLLQTVHKHDFFSLCLLDIFPSQAAVGVDPWFALLLNVAISIEEVEQAALLSAFLLFNRESIAGLLSADRGAREHILSGPANMAELLPCPMYLHRWINDRYEETFVRAWDTLFCKLTRRMSPFKYQKLAEFVFSIMVSLKRYIRGPSYVTKQGAFLPQVEATCLDECPVPSWTGLSSDDVYESWATDSPSPCSSLGKG